MTEIQDYLDEAAQLFADMDRAYEAVASRLGFNCRGCDDNCCRSLFFHHTLVEFFWLRSGFGLLPEVDQERVRLKAAEVAAHETDRQTRGDDRRPICPLNFQGRCSLYAHRPMICRLHGIPHELQAPDGRIQTGSGCDAFYTLTSSAPPDAIRLDRTPWYMGLAQLERRLRAGIGYGARIKMTISQMVGCFQTGCFTPGNNRNAYT